MSTKRIGAGITGVAIGLIMFGGVAGAQAQGTDSSDILPAKDFTSGGPSVPNDQLGEGLTAPDEQEVSGGGQRVSAAAAAAAVDAPEGSLPITGGDVVGLALIGAAAVGAGTVLVRRSRTAQPA